MDPISVSLHFSLHLLNRSVEILFVAIKKEKKKSILFVISVNKNNFVALLFQFQ
jgi:hypothetical protein